MKNRLNPCLHIHSAYTYYQYSNLGLTLAGEIVARVSGQDYETYITENIIKPLGLEDTRSYMPQDLHGTRLAMAYFPDENPPTDLTMLKQIENNRFQRIRDDGEPGEEIEFVLDKTGHMVSIKQHSNYWKKIK